MSLILWYDFSSSILFGTLELFQAVSLYCQTLEALEVLPLSIQYLQDMENFLASAFSRIPTPAIAPFAFEKFWRATYHGHSQFCNILPPKIKSCLACFVAAYGGDLADGLSLATGSQSQSTGDDYFARNTNGFRLKSNGSQVHFPASHQHQDSGEFSLRVSPSSTSINAGAWAGVTDMEVAPHGQQTFTGQEDTTFLIPSSSDALQPTVLRQLQEYSSRIDASSPDVSERSASCPKIPFPPGGAMPPEKNHSVTLYVSHQKWKRADDGNYV